MLSAPLFYLMYASNVLFYVPPAGPVHPHFQQKLRVRSSRYCRVCTRLVAIDHFPTPVIEICYHCYNILSSLSLPKCMIYDVFALAFTLLCHKDRGKDSSTAFRLRLHFGHVVFAEGENCLSGAAPRIFDSSRGSLPSADRKSLWDFRLRPPL